VSALNLNRWGSNFSGRLNFCPGNTSWSSTN